MNLICIECTKKDIKIEKGLQEKFGMFFVCRKCFEMSMSKMVQVDDNVYFHVQKSLTSDNFEYAIEIAEEWTEPASVIFQDKTIVFEDNSHIGRAYQMRGRIPDSPLPDRARLSTYDKSSELIVISFEDIGIAKDIVAVYEDWLPSRYIVNDSLKSGEWMIKYSPIGNVHREMKFRKKVVEEVVIEPEEDEDEEDEREMGSCGEGCPYCDPDY